MKSLISRFLLCVAYVFFFHQALSYAESSCCVPSSFWVSPSGNDANPGTRQAPFFTIDRARRAVWALPSLAFRNQDVYIYLEDGLYRLQRPIELTQMDSGRECHDVVYCAAPGAHPVISGAIQVTDWTVYDEERGIYRAYAGYHSSRQLYVNGRRAERAQTTPYPVGFLPSPTGGGIEFIPTDLNPIAWRDPSTWTNPENIEAVILTQWKMMSVPLCSVIPYDPLVAPTGLLTMQEPAWNNSNVYYSRLTDAPGIWSFWQVTRFENAYEFLTEPGQWYLDNKTGYIYYMPLSDEDLSTADVELPILEALVVGNGVPWQPIQNIRFEGLTFTGATWLGPSSPNGYVADQSGFLLVGPGHQPNLIGHDPCVVPTPGNLSFTYAHCITFYGNIFEHLGAVGLYFGTGSQCNTIESNLFTDISSSAIILGGVSEVDYHPNYPQQITQDNLITNNFICSVARQYMDAAAVFVGFTRKTTVSHNTIVDVPWSGIAMGWGWGLLDKGSFPGLPGAYTGEWGIKTTLTPNYGCAILNNRICDFLNVLWDGGAIYTTGQQGPSLSTGLLIKGNVASGKRPDGGGNTFYTDGGSRYIRLEQNASYDNPIGVTYLGPPPPPNDPLPYPSIPSDGNGVPYGSDSGGCVTFGDIQYTDNYWLEAPIPEQEVVYNAFYQAFLGFAPYSEYGFFDICPYTSDGITYHTNGVSYPTNLSYTNNHSISSMADIPAKILQNAGVRDRPHTIPWERWGRLPH